jgi:hypothetical protein
MKQLILIALLFSSIFSFAQEKVYAVQLCAERDKETFPAWCAQQDIEFVTYLNNRFAVVRTKDANAGKLSAFCFSTPVRVADQHLAFNTNTILVN